MAKPSAAAGAPKGLVARPASRRWRVQYAHRRACARHGAHDPFLMYSPMVSPFATFLFSDAQAVSLAGLRPPPRFRWPARPPLVILTSLFPRGLDRHYMYPSTFAVAASLCVYLRCVGSGVQRARGAFTCSANIDNPNPPLSYTGSSQERPTRASGLACRDEKYLYLDLYGLYCSSTAGSRRYTEQRAPHRSRIRHSPSHPHTEQ